MSGADPSIVLFPGLGADARLFREEQARFPNLTVVSWIEPRGPESLADYAARMASDVSELHPSYIGGASFGGMVARGSQTPASARRVLARQLPLAPFDCRNVSIRESIRERPSGIAASARRPFRDSSSQNHGIPKSRNRKSRGRNVSVHLAQPDPLGSRSNQELVRRR